MRRKFLMQDCRFRVHRASKLKILAVGGQVKTIIDVSAEKEGEVMTHNPLLSTDNSLEARQSP
jgi:hypothetical protein